jgi:hypothetical protein
MIMIHHEASDETTALNVDGSDTNVDTLRVEKVSASLKSKIESLIQSIDGGMKNLANFKSTSTFSNSIPNSAFKSTNSNNNSNDLSSALNSGSPAQFDENFISNVFSILFTSNYKSKVVFYYLKND